MSFSGGQKAKMAMCCMEFKKLAYLVETEDGNLVELSSQVVKRTKCFESSNTRNDRLLQIRVDTPSFRE